MSADLPRHPLATKEGWAAFVSRSRPEPPRLLAGTDLERLDPDERELYNYARMDYHSELDPHRFRRHHPKWHDGLRGENRKWDRPVRSTPRNIRMRLWSW